MTGREIAVIMIVARIALRSVAVAGCTDVFSGNLCGRICLSAPMSLLLSVLIMADCDHMTAGCGLSVGVRLYRPQRLLRPMIWLVLDWTAVTLDRNRYVLWLLAVR